jgi:hypothetical protein
MHAAHLRHFALLGAALIVTVGTATSASAQSAGWQPGPGAVLDNTYDGFIDVPTNGSTVPGSGSFSVSGWFIDTTAQGWAGADDVQVWLGTMDGGGRMLAKASFAQSRPDVGAAEGNPFWSDSGFVADVPGSSVPGGTQTLYVYVHTSGKGWWFKNIAVNGGGTASTSAAAPAPVAAPSGSGSAPQVTITNPSNNQDVSTRSDYTINGGVDDPQDTTIDVWINGERNTKYATDLGTATPGSDGSWSVTFKPTRFPSTHSNLYTYARNRATGLETLVVTEINIVDR